VFYNIKTKITLAGNKRKVIRILIHNAENNTGCGITAKAIQAKFRVYNVILVLLFGDIYPRDTI
jgi:hypothetical protein